MAAKRKPQPKARKPTRRPRKPKGPDLATLSIAELRKELDRRSAIRDGAPTPDELVELTAIERARLRQSCGTLVTVEALDIAGIQGDYLRYTAVFLASGPLEKRELQDVLARLERPMPDSDSRPEKKQGLRRFRESA